MCALAAEQLPFGAKVAAVAQRGSRRSVAGCRALREPILIGSASELILLSVYYLLEFLDDRQVSPHPLEPAPLPPLPPPELTHDRGSILACSRVCASDDGEGRGRGQRPSEGREGDGGGGSTSSDGRRGDGNGGHHHYHYHHHHHLPPPSLAAAAAAPRALCERAVCACVCGMVCGGSAWHRAARRLGARCCSRGSRVRSGCSVGRCAQEDGLRGSVGAIRTFFAHERLFRTNVGTWSVVKDVRVRVSYVCMCNRFRPIKKCFSSTLHL